MPRNETPESKTIEAQLRRLLGRLIFHDAPHVPFLDYYRQGRYEAAHQEALTFRSPVR